MISKAITRAALLAAVVAGGFYYFSVDERSAIGFLLEKLSRELEVRPGGKRLEAMASVKRITRLFAPEMSLSLELEGYDRVTIVSRAELEEKLLLLKTKLDSFEVAFQDVQIEILSGGGAEVEMSASALGSMPELDGQFFEKHRVLVKLRGGGEEWVITDVVHLRNEREE